MREKQFEQLTKHYLLPSLPGYCARGGLLYQNPVRHLVCGYCFDGSSFNKSVFYLHVFVQPLYVPSSHIILSLGDRIFRGEITADNEASVMKQVEDVIKKEGSRFLSQYQSPVELGAKLKPNDYYLQEVKAASLIVSGQMAQSRRELEKLVMMIEAGLKSPELSWLEVNLRRCHLMLEKLESREEIMALLDGWEKETAHSLGVKIDS